MNPKLGSVKISGYRVAIWDAYNAVYMLLMRLAEFQILPLAHKLLLVCV